MQPDSIDEDSSRQGILSSCEALRQFESPASLNRNRFRGVRQDDLQCASWDYVTKICRLATDMDTAVFAVFSFAHTHRPARLRRGGIHRGLQCLLVSFDLYVPIFDLGLHSSDVLFKCSLISIGFGEFQFRIGDSPDDSISI